MQGSSAQQNMASSAKSTSTPEMKWLLVLSAVAAVVQAVALLGWITAKVDAGIIQIGFIGLDPPITSIVFFAALFCIPTALATPLVMFTHWKPSAVLLGSQQLTDSLRGQFAAPFRMKYLYFVQALVNGISLLSLKYQFFWPAALNILNICLYCAGLFLVFQHFKRDSVPTDLASTAGSMIGSTADVARIDAMERDIRTLKQELEQLKSQQKAKLGELQAQQEVKLEEPRAQQEAKPTAAATAASGPNPSVWGSVWGSIAGKKSEAASEEMAV